MPTGAESVRGLQNAIMINSRGGKDGSRNFNFKRMKRNRATVIYSVDRFDRIISVNREWVQVAYEYELEQLFTDRIIGQNLWRYLAKGVTQDLYRMVMERIRKTGEDVAFELRCDLPEKRRLYRLSMSLGDESSIIFRVDPVEFENRPEQEFFRSIVLGGKSELVNMCSWCCRFKGQDGSWLEVEDFVALTPGTMSSDSTRISHSMCGDCYHRLTETSAR